MQGSRAEQRAGRSAQVSQWVRRPHTRRVATRRSMLMVEFIGGVRRRFGASVLNSASWNYADFSMGPPASDTNRTSLARSSYRGFTPFQSRTGTAASERGGGDEWTSLCADVGPACRNGAIAGGTCSRDDWCSGLPRGNHNNPGQPLPPPDPKFGGVIEEKASEFEALVAAAHRAAEGCAQRAAHHDG